MPAFHFVCLSSFVIGLEEDSLLRSELSGEGLSMQGILDADNDHEGLARNGPFASGCRQNLLPPPPFLCVHLERTTFERRVTLNTYQERSKDEGTS